MLLSLEIARLCAEQGLSPDSEQIEGLGHYLQLLQHWNSTYNLTAVRDPAQMLTQHIADCLAVVEPLRRHAVAGRLLDVGSGGGLPAVVIAVLLPAWQVTSVDAVAKKAAFVRQVASALPLANLHSEHSRVEQLRSPPFDVVASRAFASLRTFTGVSSRLLQEDGAWLAMKGQIPSAEIAELSPNVEVFHVEQISVVGLSAARCLVWMRKARQGSAAPTGLR